METWISWHTETAYIPRQKTHSVHRIILKIEIILKKLTTKLQITKEIHLHYIRLSNDNN
jgi:hypothetical protein